MNAYVKAACFSLLFGIYLAADDPFLTPFQSGGAPSPCPPKEMFKYCLSNCSTCDRRGVCCERKGPGGVCLSACLRNGCDCIPHHFRLRPGGPCEPVGNCPKPECGEGEVFRACGPIFEGCGALNSRALSCDYKCYCRAGLKRDADGRCVPQEDCPARARCPHNEEMRDTGPADEYCMRADGKKGEEKEVLINKTQCYCKEGFKRNTLGHCSPENFCLKTCFNDEVYQECPRKCNSTCRNYGDPDCEDDGQCYPGCFCPRGLYMDDMRRCVPLERCPPGSNPFVPTAAPPVEVTISSSGDVEDDTTAAPSGATQEVATAETKTGYEYEETTDDEEMEDGRPDEDIATPRAPKKPSPPTKRPKVAPNKKPKTSPGRSPAKSSKPKSADIDDYFNENE